MIDLTWLAPHAFNAVLLCIVGFLIKNKLNDVCERITRIENTFFIKEGK